MPERNIIPEIATLAAQNDNDDAVYNRLIENLKSPTTKLNPYDVESLQILGLPPEDVKEIIKNSRIFSKTQGIAASRNMDEAVAQSATEDAALKGHMDQWKLQERDRAPDSPGTKFMKSVAQAASWIPAVAAPGGLPTRLVLGGLGALDTYMNADKPPDFTTSAASAGLGYGLNKLRALPEFGKAVYRDWNKTGIPRVLTAGAIGGGEAALQAGLPGLVTDRGLRAPDAETFSTMRTAGGLGALFGGIGRGVLSSAATNSGTSKIQDVAAGEWGSWAMPPNLNSQLIGRKVRLGAADKLSPKINAMTKLVDNFDEVSRAHREAVAVGDTATAAKLLPSKNAAQAQVIKNFGDLNDIPREALGAVQRAGGVRALINTSLDTIFKGDPKQNTVDSVLEQVKGLKGLARIGGDTTDKHLKGATIGYLLENFSTPTKEGAGFLQRQGKMINYIANEIFPEDKELPQKLKKFVDGTTLAMREAFASGDNDIGLYTSNAGVGVRIKNAWWKIKPIHMAEKIQQGKAPLLASFGDTVGYLKALKKNPTQKARVEQALGKLLMDFGFEKDEE